MWNPVAPRNLLVAELIVYATIDYQDDQSLFFFLVVHSDRQSDDPGSSPGGANPFFFI